MNQKVQRIIELLDLKPHTIEGGYFKETYRSDEIIDAKTLNVRYKSSRAYSTAIYYLLTPGTYSSIHKLASDEIFHFYAGDPVEMLQLHEDGSGQIVKMGTDLEKGYLPQVVVPKFTWQGACLMPGGEFALLGTTVSPGFDYEDYIIPEKNDLKRKYPAFTEWIEKLFAVL
jgi:uncharacterized protein